MANADVAWVDVLPSARRFLPELQRQTGPAARTAGVAAGRDFGSAFGSSGAQAVSKANAQMSAALRKTADTAGQVRVAELKLKELRESGRATASQVAAAEERLAGARRKETAANGELSASSRRVRDAQQQHTEAVGRGNAALTEGNKRAGILTRTFGGMRGAVATGFAAFYAAQTAVRFIGDAIHAASDLGEQTNKVKVVFGQSSQAVLGFSKTTAKSLGISQTAALTSAGTFGNLFRAIGITEKSSGGMSIQLVKTAADLASFNNASPEDVLEAMRAGLVGETEPLRKFGINISDAAMRAELLAEGVKLQSGPLTAAQKAQAAYALILKQTTLAQGDFERTSDSLANRQRILSATWDDAKAKLGGLLVGPATAFTGWLIKLIPKVQAFGGWLKDNAKTIGIAATALGALVLVTKAHSTALAISAAGGMAQWATQAKGISAVTKAWAAVQWVLNASIMGFPLIWIAAALAAVGVAVVMLWKRSETFRNIVLGVWAAVQNAIRFAWERVIKPVWAALSDAAVWLWQKVLQPTFRFILTAWDVMSAAIRTAWQKVIKPVWDVIAGAAIVLFRILTVAVFAPIWAAWKLMSAAIGLAWRNVLKPVWDAVSKGATWLWEHVLRPVFGWIGDKWDAVMKAVRWVYDKVVAPMWGILKSAVGSVQKAWASAVSGIEEAWNRIKGIAAAPINFVIRTVLRDGLFKAWNWLLDKLGIDSWKIDLKASWLQGIKLASGGPVPGYSPHPRADNIPLWGTAGEYMVQQPIARQTTPFLEALNSGNREALAAARTWGRYATGGQIYEFTRATFPRAKLNSAYRPGAPDYHGSNNAADMGEAGFSGGAGRSYIALMKQWWYDNFGRQAEEIIYTGLYNKRPQVKNGHDNEYSSFINATHTNHLHVAETGRLGGSVGAPSGGGGGSADTPWYVSLWHTITGAWDWVKKSFSSIGQLAKKFGSSPMTGWLAELPGMLAGKAWDKVKGVIGGLFSGFTNGVGFSDISDSSAIKLAVKSTATQYAFNSDAQWAALDWIIQHESGWNPRAQNPISTASGLFQQILSTWLAYRPAGVTALNMKDAGIGDQARAGMSYIRDRYGTPTSAKAFWQSNNWYGYGGPVFHDGGTTARWRTDALALLGPDERVLSAPQDDYFRRFVDAVGGGGGSGVGKRQIAEHMTVMQQPGESTDEFVERLWHKWKAADRGGVYSDTLLGG